MIVKATFGVLGLVGALVAYMGVRPFVVGVLNLYRKFNLFVLKLRGKTPDDEVAARIVAGKAWEEYCDTLKAAGAALLSSGCPSDPFTQAEGYRYLTRLVRGSLENYMECADVLAPRLVAIANGGRAAPVKIGSDNPDNLYQNAAISSRYSYRLRIQRGSVHYLGFGSQAGSYGGPGGLRTVDYKEADEFEIDNNGYFEVIFSNERPKGCKNWLRTDPSVEKALIIVRQTFNDRENETPATGEIELLDGPALPEPVTCNAIAEALHSSGMFVAAVPMLFAKWAKDMQAHTNELPLFDQEKSNKAGGDPNIRYYHSYWKLENDEALIISATPPEVDHWNFQLNNHWMESLDYRYFKVHVNMHTASYRDDKSVRLIITHKDPASAEGMEDPKVGAYDWINTTGHNCGTMCFRWIRPKTDIGLPQPQTKVVKVNDIAATLLDN